jgi:hypothetical protein
MSEVATTSSNAGWLADIGMSSREGWTAPDSRRRLQLILGGIWLLDGVLQLQSFMFTRGFGQMLATAASGNPAVIADPIISSARLIDQHAIVMNAIFAAIQLLLGLGIAWRPTVRLALGASIAWALAVWWLGEGLGGILTGSASPVNGAPGAVILYALVAVLLWPVRRDRPAPFAAGQSTGPAAARLLWLALWGGLAYLALQPAARAPQGLSRTISGMAAGEPGWLVSADRALSQLLTDRGLEAAVALAVVLAVVAVGIYLPRPAARAAVTVAIVMAGAIWIAQGLGGMLTGSGTDPNTGPLLALLALAYWPQAGGGPARISTEPASGG